MIKKSHQRKVEKRTAMRGGKGAVQVEHLFTSEEIKAKCRFCAILKVDPLSSIGLHKHETEDELFVVLKGRGIIVDGDGNKTCLEEGDASLTGNGEEHSLVNESATDNLEVLAVIMQY
jgi:mannose-6-phosphate isomerase-like protein (cupin superfamily)